VKAGLVNYFYKRNLIIRRMSVNQTSSLYYFPQATNMVSSFVSNPYNYATSWYSYDGAGSNIARMAAYLFSILVVIFVILIFVHYFIAPVFRLHPGAPGIIPVPGWDDGVLFWNKGNSETILNKDLPISNMYFGYSMNMDIFVENPFQFSKYHRIIFSRGGERQSTPSGETLLGAIHSYNLAVALLPDTNDLLVSVLNSKNNMENVIISNVPVQESFRLGIVVMENALEVYVNGELAKTRTFSATPLDSKGDIQQASGIELNVAKIKNLKIWPRILTTSELRYAKPDLSPSADFGAGPIPASTSCPVASS
jgi:hypothetical protein